MHSSSLQTRTRRSALSCAIGANRPELVVMSGTERTNSMPLAFTAAMMVPPLRLSELPSPQALPSAPSHPILTLKLDRTCNLRNRRQDIGAQQKSWPQGQLFRLTGIGELAFLMRCGLRRQAIGPGVVRDDFVSQPSADERHDAIGKAGIGFARRQRPIDQNRRDHRIEDHASAGRYAIGAERGGGRFRGPGAALLESDSRPRRRCRLQPRFPRWPGANPDRGKAKSTARSNWR